MSNQPVDRVMLSRPMDGNEKYALHHNHQWPLCKGLIGSSVAPWVSSEQGPDRPLVRTWWEYSWPCMFKSYEAYIDLSKTTRGAAARGGSQDEVKVTDEWDSE